MNCSHCNSDNILSDLVVTDNSTGMDYAIYKDRKPDALIFKDRVRYPLKAHLCADCKHVMFFAKDEVYEKEEKNLKD